VIDCAENGREAAELYAKNEEAYALIFMDVHMPEMDGYEATRLIRDTAARAGRIPIIALTANAFREDVLECRAAGMDDHVAKPVRQDELFGILAKYLTPGGPAADKKINSEKVRSGMENKETYLPYIDAAEGAGRVMNNINLYTKLLKSFLAKDSRPELRQLLDEKDTERAKAAAHTVKGVAANLSLKPLFEASLKLETALKENSYDGAAIREFFETYDVTVEKVTEFTGS